MTQEEWAEQEPLDSQESPDSGDSLDLEQEVEDVGAGHVPVLLQQTIELLAPKPGAIVVDATVGAGGHAVALAKCIGAEGRLIGLDVDPVALALARSALAQAPCRVDLIQANFSEVSDALSSIGVQAVSVLLADLGVSSMQLDVAERGFSFRREGPLDMRMDPRLKVTAADLVNRLSDKELGNLIYYNAQEFAARKIASAIVEARRSTRITTTNRLADIVCRALRINPDSRKSKIHPATRTFQALRMAVNQEVASLETFLQQAPRVLAPGARVGVIAFHSVEDKVVKMDFRKRGNEGEYRIMTKKPIVANEDERISNPRSRSAKFRVAERLDRDRFD